MFSRCVCRVSVRGEYVTSGDCYDSIAHITFTDNCFLMSTLADALRSMDVSRSPDSLTMYPRFPYHVPPVHVLVCPLSVLRISPCMYLYCFGLTTRLWLLVCFTFLLLSHRLVYAYHCCLCLSFCSLSTCLPSCYFWTMTRL